MFSFIKKGFSNTRVYLDYAGTASVSDRAKAELSRTLSIFGNPSAIHKEGAIASQALDRTRGKVARILNAHAYEIIFVGSGTESCNLAVLGTYFGTKNEERRTKNVPHIITSSIEHPSVLEPIRHLEKEGKILVTYLPVYEDGVVKVSDMRNALTPDTILVSIMYANNEIGTLQPVKEIGRAIEEWKKEQNRNHTAYPYFHIDACQAGNYLSLDVLRLRCHLMSVNSSKLYGPKGIALIYKREGIRIEPITYGGGQERGLRSGTESVALALSFAEALSESQEMKDKEVMRLQTLRDDFKKGLEVAIPSVVFYGAWDDESHKNMKRLPNNINFRVPGIQSEEMILRLDAKGFAVSHKSACASQEDDGSYVIMALGATEKEAKENIRVTLGRDTIWKDLERLIDAIVDINNKYSNNK